MVNNHENNLALLLGNKAAKLHYIFFLLVEDSE